MKAYQTVTAYKGHLRYNHRRSLHGKPLWDEHPCFLVYYDMRIAIIMNEDDTFDLLKNEGIEFRHRYDKSCEEQISIEIKSTDVFAGGILASLCIDVYREGRRYQIGILKSEDGEEKLLCKEGD